jgi:hypothetical protein
VKEKEKVRWINGEGALLKRIMPIERGRFISLTLIITQPLYFNQCPSLRHDFPADSDDALDDKWEHTPDDNNLPLMQALYVQSVGANGGGGGGALDTQRPVQLHQ